MAVTVVEVPLRALQRDAPLLPAVVPLPWPGLLSGRCRRVVMLRDLPFAPQEPDRCRGRW